MGTGLLSTPVDGSVSTGQLADGGITPIKFSTSGISAGNVIKVNDAGTAWELGAASSAEVYGFHKDSNGDLIVTTTNQGEITYQVQHTPHLMMFYLVRVVLLLT